MQINTESKRKIDIYDAVFMAALLIYTGVCLYLYVNQLNYPVTGRFEADTPVHVSMAVKDGFMYSLTALVYILFVSVFPAPNFFIGLFLALSTSGAVLLTAKLFIKVASAYRVDISKGIIYISSFATNCLMAFYVGFINKQHYIGYQSANMWHNSTYLVMRLVALWALILYFDLYTGKDFRVRKLVGFSLVLALSVAVKPSFFVVFAPVMALELLWDWLKKKEKFSKVFFAALTVVPSMLVLLLQSLVLFGNGTGNGYKISPFTALSQRGDHPKVTLILSILFPLMMLALHIKDVFKDRLYAFCLLIWAVGFCEVFFFVETGSRSGDGNFFWGYSIALFILFAEAVFMLIKDLKGVLNSKKAGEKVNTIKTAYLSCASVVLLWHFVSGIVYFILLLAGNTYFI